MKQIQLTQGQVALVDDEDFERINAHKWQATWNPSAKTWFAIRSTPRERGVKRRVIYMHREVMNALPGEYVDHVHHDTLDNRRGQLRICTNAQNQANRKPSFGSSRFKGVSWIKRDRSWTACVRHQGKSVHLGVFPDEVSAACAYDSKSLELFGEFALTNKMLGLL